MNGCSHACISLSCRPLEDWGRAGRGEANPERDVGGGGAEGLSGGSPGGAETQREGRGQRPGGCHALQGLQSQLGLVVAANPLDMIFTTSPWGILGLGWVCLPLSMTLTHLSDVYESSWLGSGSVSSPVSLYASVEVHSSLRVCTRHFSSVFFGFRKGINRDVLKTFEKEHSFCRMYCSAAVTEENKFLGRCIHTFFMLITDWK